MTRWIPAAIAFSFSVAACKSGSTGPPGSRIRITSGANQTGRADSTLKLAITVHLAGHPAALDVPRARAYEMMRDGLLPSVRLGRAVRVDRERLRDCLAHGGTPRCSGAPNT